MTALVIAATSLPAAAQTATLRGTPLLDGSSLGTVRDRAGTTDPAETAPDPSDPSEGEASSPAATGPCVTPEHPDGQPNAAIYNITASRKSFLDVAVTASKGTICRISVYQASLESEGMEDPYDATQRERFLVAETTTCVSGSCRATTWLTTGLSAYVVIWAAPAAEPTSEPTSVPFRYTARARVPLSIGTAVSGHRIFASSYHEVIAPRPFTLTMRLPAPGRVHVRGYIYDNGTWDQVWTTNPAISNQRATLTLVRRTPARLMFRISYLGDDRHLPVYGGTRYVKVVNVRWTRYSDGGVKLHVPWYHQEYRLSCEASSLRMVLAFYGIKRRDWTILNVIGIDDRPRRNGRWGDPEKAFVGKVTGTMPRTGYGVHAPPVARAATKYRPTRPAVLLKGVSYATIAKHVNNGFPVVIWGAHRGTSGIHKTGWRSWEGRWVTAWLIEHTWTVIGYRGQPSSPTHFIVHNPSGRSTMTVTRGTFYHFTKYFGTSGVVVR